MAYMLTVFLLYGRRPPVLDGKLSSDTHLEQHFLLLGHVLL